jgi:predicted porin
MKKSLLALAALSAFAGVASAQSSVTLFGIVDVNVRNQKSGGGDQTSVSTDGINSSRLGFRGVEDLGGGLRAGFWIEGALSPDTGCGTSTNATPSNNSPACGGQTWQRRSTVSLLGSFGEVRLGRDYTPTFWNHTVFDVFGTNGVGSELNIFSKAAGGASTLVRANNTVGYFLPSLGGFYGQVQVAAGETPGATSSNKYAGGRLGYGAGPFNIAAAYGITYAEGAVANVMVDDETEWNVGGSFAFSFLTIMGQYSMSEYSSNENKSWTVGVSVPFGASTIKASYGETEFATASSSPKVKQIAIGYQYDLSKRTAIYANAAQLENDAGLARTTSGNAPVVGTGFKSTGYELGLRHSF